VPRIISDAALLSAFAPLEAYPSAALAVSGGPDSMALMYLAARWLTLKGRAPASITVFTVDHGLRPEAAEEAAFVATRAAGLGFSHTILAWAGQKPKTGIQAAAREARYGLMTAYACEHRIACLVTAHTEDDQAETFLMRLRRGSGLDGLAAMAAVSERGGVPIVRPLLSLSKSRLIACLRSLGVPFATDPSNSNTTFERVRVRHAMKVLAAAGITRPALALSASRLGRGREALASTAEEFLQRHFSVTSLGQAQIGLEPYLELAPEIALRVLSRALALIGGKEEPPRMAKVERLLNELRAGKREAALGGCLIIAAAGVLNFYREPGRMDQARQVCQPGSTFTWDNRFILTLASDLSGDLTVAPLGAGGWAICRNALKERGKTLQANRLAALASPALWQGSRLVHAPCAGFTDAELAGPNAVPLRTQLAPRLSYFLIST
jgi:tRNA(Ile)-lysidine synthase